MSALFTRSRSRQSHSDVFMSSSPKEALEDPLLQHPAIQGGREPHHPVTQGVNNPDHTVIQVVDDPEGDDEEEDCAAVKQVSQPVPCSRHQSVRSVRGSAHEFTVIQYEEVKSDDPSCVPLPSPGTPRITPFPSNEDVSKQASGSECKTSTSSGDDIKLSMKEGNTPQVVRDLKKPLRTSVSQRSFSLDDDQVFRKAVKNNNILKAVHFAQGDVVEDTLDEVKESVYKSWDTKRDGIDLARWGRLFGSRKIDRLVRKSGEYNIIHVNQAKKSKRYMQDIFTTLLEMKWKFTILMLVLTFLLGWVLFALMWWGLAVSYKKRTDGTNECVIGVYDFVTALLFSIETQQTIGYGTRAVTEQCPAAILLVMIQSVFGVVIQCVLTGLVFAKLGRAKKRGETVMFSKNAVISRHRGNLCLMFQVADMRKSHMICVSVSGIMVKHKLRKVPGQDMSKSMRQYRLNLHTEVDEFLFLAMPVRVIHTIDEHSPLYDIGRDQLIEEDFEIVVVLEGVNETTGMSTQVRTSYLPGEIMWGHKHGPLITNQRKNGTYNIDYTRFNDVVPVHTPKISAKELAHAQANCHDTSIWHKKHTSLPRLAFSANHLHEINDACTLEELDENDTIV